MKITQAQIDQVFDQAEKIEQIYFDKCFMIVAKLPNGFVISGKGVCVDPNDFVESIGRKVATEQIKNKIWELEGYALQELLSQTEANTQIC